MAALIDLCSNYVKGGFTPGELAKLGQVRALREVAPTPEGPTSHALARRFSGEDIAKMVERFKAGESARSLACEHGVAASAVVRLLREQGLEVSKRRVSKEDAMAMAAEYEAGATMAELEAKYNLSHGAVYRALHRTGVETRASAPRTKQ